MRRTLQVADHIKPAAKKGLSERGIAEIRARTIEARKMSGTSTPMTGASTPLAQEDNGKKKLKILMLHGKYLLLPLSKGDYERSKTDTRE